MAEHAVADIMDQGRRKRYLCLMEAVVPRAISVNMPLDHLHQLPRYVEHTDAVREPGMGGAGKDEFGESELPDTA
jgi:hypothetical protein